MTEPEVSPALSPSGLAPAAAAGPKRKVFVRWVIGFIVAGCAVGAVSGVVLALSFASYKVPAGSMWPTLVVGDHVVVNKRAKEPERGALVVFRLPENHESTFVKRIIGMPGDEVTITKGEPTVNGWKVPRCNVGPGWFVEATDGDVKHEGMVAVEFLGSAAYLAFDDTSAPDLDVQGPYTVKAGEYFVMGDNRRNSHDSRTWFGGAGGGVPLGNTVGRVRGHDEVALRKDVEGLAGLAPALDACLAKRPTETTPPPPKTPGK